MEHVAREKAMPAEPPPHVLDYGVPRRRAGFDVAAAVVTALILITLNVLPHFVAPVPTHAADVPKAELGWPWVFYFYGQTYGGYGPSWVPERIVYDAISTSLIVSGVGLGVARIRHGRSAEKVTAAR